MEAKVQYNERMMHKTKKKVQKLDSKLNFKSQWKKLLKTYHKAKSAVTKVEVQIHDGGFINQVE